MVQAAKGEVGVVRIASIVVLLGFPGAWVFNGKGTGIPIPFVGLSTVLGDVGVIGGWVVPHPYQKARWLCGRGWSRGWLTPRLWQERRWWRRRASGRGGKP